LDERFKKSLPTVAVYYVTSRVLLGPIYIYDNKIILLTCGDYLGEDNLTLDERLGVQNVCSSVFSASEESA